MYTYINESIPGKFNQRDLDELYSLVEPTKQKYEDFNQRILNSPSGPYLEYLGTSSTVRDLVALGDAIVGEGKLIDYWGFSYGSVIGFNFLNSELSKLPYCALQLKSCSSVPRGMLYRAQVSKKR